jgi:hypothetical protein
MNQALHQPDPDTEAERRLLEAFVAEARADPSPGVPHEQVRADMLCEIERLNRQIA